MVCGEPVFAPDPTSTDEDGGWILVYLNDVTTDRSAVAVLDAVLVTETARVDLVRRVPFGFHGSRLP